MSGWPHGIDHLNLGRFLFPLCQLVAFSHWVLMQPALRFYLYFSKYLPFFSLSLSSFKAWEGVILSDQLTPVWTLYSCLGLLLDLHISYIYASHAWTSTTTFSYVYCFSIPISPLRPQKLYTQLISGSLSCKQCNLSYWIDLQNCFVLTSCALSTAIKCC